MIRIFFGIFALQSFINLIIGKNFLLDISNWSVGMWLTRLRELARYSFFFQEKVHIHQHHSVDIMPENVTIGSTEQFSLLDYFLVCFMSLGMLQRYVLGYFTDLCILTCAITIWLHANAFAKSIIIVDKKTGIKFAQSSFPKEKVTHIEESWDRVYANFLAVQTLSVALNKAVGNQVTLYIAESVMYYSLNLNAVLTIVNPLRRLEMVYFYILTVGTFVISANICSQVAYYSTQYGFQLPILFHEFPKCYIKCGIFHF